MIRFDGYYLEEPIEVFNKRSDYKMSSFAFDAYLFDEDNNLKVVGKHDFLENLNDFVIEDFTDKNSDIFKYNKQNNQIKILKQYEFADDIFVDIINSNELYNKTRNKKLYFVKWDNDEIKNDFEKTNMSMLFGPFPHKKYEVFFE